MSDESSVPTKAKELGCLTVVGTIFVVLKLLSIPPVASWSWIWVLCPFWISIAIGMVALILLILIYVILNIIAKC